MNLHFLVYRLANLVRRFVGDIYQFARCHFVVVDVYGSEDAEVCDDMSKGREKGVTSRNHPHRLVEQARSLGFVVAIKSRRYV